LDNFFNVFAHSLELFMPVLVTEVWQSLNLYRHEDQSYVNLK